MRCNVTAYIGRDYGDGEHTAEHVCRIAARALKAAGIDSMTLSECVGVWHGETEQSIRVDLLQVDPVAARKALKWTCRALKQWAIVYTIDGAGMLEVTDNAAKRRAA